MKAVYYPKKANELDNRHPVVEIIGTTATGRVQIEWEDAEGKHKATVSPFRLEAGQQELIE